MRGRTPGPRRDTDVRRAGCFAGAMVALGVALLSPLDALAGALASAHMVQHVLLLVAAPLLALSAPSSTILRGSPLAVRRAGSRWRRRSSRVTATCAPCACRPPSGCCMSGTLWPWHAAVPWPTRPWDQLVHVAEHVSFLVTAVLFWRVVIGARSAGGCRTAPASCWSS